MSDEDNKEVQAPTEAGADPQASEEQTSAQTEENQPITESAADLSAAIEAAPVVEFYMGQQVTERLGNFDASGAEECRLLDGTTAFVPKSN